MCHFTNLSVLTTKVLVFYKIFIRNFQLRNESMNKKITSEKAENGSWVSMCCDSSPLKFLE